MFRGVVVPFHDYIIRVMDRINPTLGVDRQKMIITVEAGLVTNGTSQVLKESGLFYVGYRMSLETCFTGGKVADG